MLRHFTAFALLLTGLFSLFWLTVAPEPELVDHAIESNRRVLDDFESAVRFIRGFSSAHDRLPSNVELEAWSQASGRLGVSFLDPDDGQSGEEAVAALGRPPEGARFLALWRGEWMEYYAPWSGQSTLSFSRGDYYLLGSQWMDMALGGLLAAMSFGGIVMLRSRKRSATPDA